jgi:hypothetical protein
MDTSPPIPQVPLDISPPTALGNLSSVVPFLHLLPFYPKSKDDEQIKKSLENSYPPHHLLLMNIV